jgi:phosphatidylglycerophosphatase A
VGWADRLFKSERGAPIGWTQGMGILVDDFVAAGCTLAVIAIYRFLMG